MVAYSFLGDMRVYWGKAEKGAAPCWYGRAFVQLAGPPPFWVPAGCQKHPGGPLSCEGLGEGKHRAERQCRSRGPVLPLGMIGFGH